jgi:hypothetical protein
MHTHYSSYNLVALTRRQVASMRQVRLPSSTLFDAGAVVPLFIYLFFRIFIFPCMFLFCVSFFFLAIMG